MSAERIAWLDPLTGGMAVSDDVAWTSGQVGSTSVWEWTPGIVAAGTASTLASLTLAGAAAFGPDATAATRRRYVRRIQSQANSVRRIQRSRAR